MDEKLLAEAWDRFNRKSNLNSKYFTFKSLPFNAISGFTEDAKRYFDDASYEIDGINELELKTPDQI